VTEIYTHLTSMSIDNLFVILAKTDIKWNFVFNLRLARVVFSVLSVAIICS